MLRTNPASAFSQPLPARASADQPDSSCRPCGFPPCEHDAVRLDVRTCCLRLHALVAPLGARRLNVPSKVSHVCNRSCEDESAHPIHVTRLRATRHIKRHRFAYSPPAAGHAPPPTFARCSATDSGLRGLAGRADPSLNLVRRRSWGSSDTLRRFAPEAGGRSFLIDRAHVPFVQPRAPIDFRRVTTAPDQ
jgi:hypothetical protein